MNRERRLWAQVMGHLLDELIGIHQRAHAAFGHKLGLNHAFPLFQGKRWNRTIVYNAEYDSSGKLRRGVLFITTGQVPGLLPRISGRSVADGGIGHLLQNTSNGSHAKSTMRSATNGISTWLR